MNTAPKQLEPPMPMTPCQDRCAKPNRVRLVVGYLIVASTLPYLTFKTIWLAGGSVGVIRTDLIHDSTMVALNLLTAGLDGVAVVLAMLLTYSWGQRVNPLYVAPPLWIGTGLLAPIAVVAPVVGIVDLFGTSTSSASQPIVHGWVYAIVYSGFTCEGLAISAAFVLYAKTRWPGLWRGTTGECPATPTTRVVAALTGPITVAAVLIAALNLLWAAHVPLGISTEITDSLTATSSLWYVLLATGALAAALGLRRLAGRGSAKHSFATAMVMTWLGSGVLAAWGGWDTLITLTNAKLGAQLQGMELSCLTNVVMLVVGSVTGVLGATVLAERHVGQRGEAVSARMPA